LGNVARTGIGSVAIAHAIPLWPVERWVKNIARPSPFVCLGSCASLNTTPFSSHRGTRLAWPSTSSGTAAFSLAWTPLSLAPQRHSLASRSLARVTK
jgi:hypothetical protein